MFQAAVKNEHTRKSMTSKKFLGKAGTEPAITLITCICCAKKWKKMAQINLWPDIMEAVSVGDPLSLTSHWTDVHEAHVASRCSLPIMQVRPEDFQDGSWLSIA